jgi:hypothetical protein
VCKSGGKSPTWYYNKEFISNIGEIKIEVFSKKLFQKDDRIAVFKLDMKDINENKYLQKS